MPEVTRLNNFGPHPSDDGTLAGMILVGLEAASAPPSPNDRPCTSCGVVGPPHGSDAECVAALKAKLERLTSVKPGVKPSKRRRVTEEPDGRDNTEM